ncbi:MAG: HAD-IA family hydrolase [Chloroflexia bacterium]
MQTDRMLLRAVLFDLDGTLINSIEHIIACWQHTVRTSLGREITREEILPTLGRALLECFEEIAPGRSQEMRAVYRDYQVQTHDTTVTLVKGTRGALDRLKAAGMRLGVVTSKGITVATEGLDLFNLVPYFDTLVTYEDTTQHKPHPDPILVGCERLGVSPHQALYVGDAVVDIQAGKAAGTLTAGVTWGASSPDTVAVAHPDFIFTTMDDLSAALAQQPDPTR